MLLLTLFRRNPGAPGPAGLPGKCCPSIIQKHSLEGADAEYCSCPERSNGQGPGQAQYASEQHQPVGGAAYPVGGGGGGEFLFFAISALIYPINSSE